MTWTRLFYVKNIDKAFARFIPGIQHQELNITKRYQAQIRKQFRLAGVPWIYQTKPLAMNPRDKKPKAKKDVIARQIRLAKIQKSLKDNQTKEVEFRQQRLNKRRPRGMDALMARGLPSWIKQNLQQIPDYMKRGRSGEESDD